MPARPASSMPAKPPVRFVSTFSAYTARRSDKLGEGGNGTVYRAEEEGTRAEVAVKVLDPSKTTKEKARRFKNEILFGQHAQHAHVLPVLDAGPVVLDGRETAFYVMPLYATTLRGLLQRGVAHDRVLPLFAGLLRGVEAAHLQGVVHRDLKPENVLYDAARDALVVGDFGVARFTDDELYTAVETRPNVRLANFQYAAPEQRARGRAVDAPADVYALGLMLNEMFTGEVPHGTGYRTVAATAPAYAFVDDLVAPMLQQAPEARPASIDVVHQRLHAARQEYVIRQKLDELHGTVVPASTIVDPLIDQPVRVVDAGATGPSTVDLVLNHAPTPRWLRVAQDASGYSYSPGRDSKDMPISGNRVTLHAAPYDVQRLVDLYKGFLAVMAREYPQAVAREANARDRRARQELNDRMAAEQQRLALQQQIRI